MKKNINLIWRYSYCVVTRFINSDCQQRAAAMAFTFLLSLVPLLTVSFGIFSAFPVFDDIAKDVQNFIINNFVAASAEQVQGYLQTFIKQTTQLSPTGLLFLLITAVLMVFNMEQAFNTIWGIERRRGWVQAFLLYWAVLTLTPILLGVGFAVTGYVASLSFVSGAAQTLGITHALLAILPFFASTVAFTLLYVALPNRHVPFLAGLSGGAVAALLFELAKHGFSLYITHFASYELLYGALAGVVIFLMWIYLSWLIILFGAVMSYVLARGVDESSCLIKPPATTSLPPSESI